MAGSAANIPVAGWVIAGVILAALIGVSIGAAVAMANAGNSSKDTAKSINDMSKSIYELNKKATSLDATISKFDDLDNKILKTNKDLEEMSSLLKSASDSLSDDEKDFFDTLQTDRARREYLETIRDNATKELQSTREEQRQALLKRGTKFLTSTDAKDIQNVDAMYSLNNAKMYEYLSAITNLTNEQRASVRKMSQSVLENLDKNKAYSLLSNDEQMSRYTSMMAATADLIAILQSDDESIKDRVEAFKQLRSSVESLGDPDITEAFLTFNNE